MTSSHGKAVRDGRGGLFRKKKYHIKCGAYHRTATSGGIFHAQEEPYRIGI
ncbi:MAG TPA: hypothetical protein DEF41_07855 [Desulfovibrio sp.]|uniref:Uncharacterized protein n=1 Tax=Nitratidesulfovibrio vulgaris (strain ATCC 29579 / DSM 644 / CCUG 34227 / NCIMB 8303 / VKM B-1760 / Hildenborough) TaxID=882 RepID=Q72E71_NITV2|nr:hypothetical protein DVU_0708 [Nitratidesulfovibrio vulgaris str. Hildenborough]HBW16035.1 hypothetical protein [Desulfovibrio sp.]